MVNPAVQNYFTPAPSMLPPITGQTSFKFPDILTGINYTVTVYYNLTSTKFVENNPVEIGLQMEIPNDPSLTYDTSFKGIAVQPNNAVNYYPENNPYPPASRFVLTMTDNDSIKQVWTGLQWVEFRSEGSITVTIQFYVSPTLAAYNIINWQSYYAKYAPFTVNVSFPNPQMESGLVAQQQTQQQIYENYNLSLTFFVLLFASIDIAVVLYDHSEPKYKQPDYE